MAGQPLQHEHFNVVIVGGGHNGLVAGAYLAKQAGPCWSLNAGTIWAELEWPHRAPFDRMIAAQAIVEGFTVITADTALHDFELLQTVW